MGAVVLAAGAGRRLGNRPKCLLMLDGASLICRQLAALAEVGVHTVVVLGHHAKAIGEAIADRPVTLVYNPQPELGPASSLRLGLQALPEGLALTWVTLADMALINAQDLRDMLNAYQRRPQATGCLVPNVAGKPGHPVIFDDAVRQDLLQRPLYNSGPQWQALGAQRVHHWPTNNPHYRWDIDTPSDIEALARQTGQTCQWPSTEDTP